MKSSSSFKFCFGIALFCLSFIFTSCGSKPGEIKIGSQDDFIIVHGNIKTWLENADCKVSSNGIELSNALKSMIGYDDEDNRELTETFCSIKGVDLENFRLIITENMGTMLAMPLTNKKEFVKWLSKLSNHTYKDLDPIKDGKYELYEYKRGAYFFIHEDVLYMAAPGGRHKSPAEFIDETFSQAEEEPLTQGLKSQLKNGNAINYIINIDAINDFTSMMGMSLIDDNSALASVYDIDKLKHAYAAVNVSFDGPKALLKTKLADEDGDVIKPKVSFDIDPSMLKYAPANSFLCMMAGFKGEFTAQSYRDMAKQISQLSHYAISASTILNLCECLKYFEGTIITAVGEDTFQNFIDNPENMSLVIAAQTKDGDANSAIAYIRGLIERQDIPTQDLPEGFSTDTLKPIYFKADGGNVVISFSQDIQGGKCMFSESEFTNKNFVLTGKMPKDIRIDNTTLTFGIDLDAFSCESTFEGKVELTGVKGNFLGLLISEFVGK